MPRLYKTVPQSLANAEIALVCACVRWPVGDNERTVIEKWSAEVGDWGQVRKLIVRHRVAGIAAHAIASIVTDLPDDMRVWCAEQKDIAAFNELGAAAELHRLTQVFQRSGIASRVLKGPAVSLTAFGRLGLRTNRDLDILVDVTDRMTASQVLAQQGYQRIEPEEFVSPAAFQDWLQHRKDFVFYHPKGFLVELHWRLFNNRALLPNIHRCAGFRIDHPPFLLNTLPPQENILYLCVHGAEHSWSRLKWLADLSALLRKMTGEDITNLITKARKEKVYPAVGQAIILCSRHLGLILPNELRKSLGNSLRIKILVWIGERSLFAGNGLELEQQRLGSTLKNIGHYLMASGPRFWRQELRFDLLDLPAAGLDESFRRFGPFARLFKAVFRGFRNESPKI